jgi:hypothetical protein
VTTLVRVLVEGIDSTTHDWSFYTRAFGLLDGKRSSCWAVPIFCGPTHWGGDRVCPTSPPMSGSERKNWTYGLTNHGRTNQPRKPYALYY